MIALQKTIICWSVNIKKKIKVSFFLYQIFNAADKLHYDLSMY